MKYSNEFRRLGQLLLTYRHSISPLSSSNRLKPYQDLLIDLYSYDPLIKDKIIELLKYQYHDELINELIQWPIPQFPISAGMLALKKVKQGMNYKVILQELKNAWKQSNFQATEGQLLNETLPIILQNLTTDSAVVTGKVMDIPPAFTLPKRRKPISDRSNEKL